MTIDLLLQNCVNSLEGYRLNCKDIPGSQQQCDAEKAARAYLAQQTVTDEKRLAALEELSSADLVSQNNRYSMDIGNIWGFDSRTDEYIIAMGIAAGKHYETLVSCLQSPVKEGWVMVPEIPTVKMLNQFYIGLDISSKDGSASYESAVRGYKAMLDATPNDDV